MFQPCFSNQLGDELRGSGKPPVHAREMLELYIFEHSATFL